MTVSKVTFEALKKRTDFIDEMISTSGHSKDFFIDNDMPTYWDAERMNEEEWNELVEYAQDILRRN